MPTKRKSRPKKVRTQPREKVNHPAHYTSHPSGVECIQITEHYGFNIGNVIKYVWRAGLKDDEMEDLRKALWYLTREIERRYRGIAFRDDCLSGNDRELPYPVTEPMPKEKLAEVSDTEPVAWAVIVPLTYGRYAIDDFFVSHSRAVEACDWRKQNTPRGAEIVPLYRHPQPSVAGEERYRMTDEERGCLLMALTRVDGRNAEVLRDYLLRTKPKPPAT